MQKKDIHIDLDQLKSIVGNVLREKSDILKEKSEYLSFLFTFSQKGDLVDIAYFLPRKTPISISDISKIDTLLKTNVKATFTGIDYLQYYFIDYSPPAIRF